MGNYAVWVVPVTGFYCIHLNIGGVWLTNDAGNVYETLPTTGGHTLRITIYNESLANPRQNILAHTYLENHEGGRNHMDALWTGQLTVGRRIRCCIGYVFVNADSSGNPSSTIPDRLIKMQDISICINQCVGSFITNPPQD